ncbi:hypothetical protein D5086_022934, partial [Populus alba]
MDGYIPHPPAQDSATSAYSSAAKGGLAGVLVMLLAIVVYVFFKRRKCSVRIEAMEALEAMLMDDGFREIHSSESGLHTSNHRFKISISPQVRLAGCSSWLGVHNGAG